MKSTLLLIILLVAIGVSVFFTYERSFVTRDFEVFNSEAEESTEDPVEEEAATEEAEDGVDNGSNVSSSSESENENSASPAVEEELVE